MTNDEKKPRDPSEKLRCYRFSLDGAGGCLIVRDEESLDALLEELRAAEIDDVFSVKVTEMTRAELDVLPEFDGW